MTISIALFHISSLAKKPNRQYLYHVADNIKIKSMYFQQHVVFDGFMIIYEIFRHQILFYNGTKFFEWNAYPIFAYLQPQIVLRNSLMAR